jgi:4-hydroxy-3-methylbut-2-enyl diphosphate reductase
MKVSIDPFAGFCFGVKRAIEIAEDELHNHSRLYCLGEIVHNQQENERLEEKGLKFISDNQLPLTEGSKVLFRAHGEPPATYDKAQLNNIKIADATCPIVHKFQKRIKLAFDEMKTVNGQIVIFGKKDHPEVIGLTGQTENKAIIIENEKDLDKIDTKYPIRLFVQTTKNKKDYAEIIRLIEEKLTQSNQVKVDFKHYNTICSQVSQRIPKLLEFCRNNEVIVFVSGKNSSNGKQLFNTCLTVNKNCYSISSENEINSNWFIKVNSVGITGATSTPVWQMKEIAARISEI